MSVTVCYKVHSSCCPLRSRTTPCQLLPPACYNARLAVQPKCGTEPKYTPTAMLLPTLPQGYTKLQCCYLPCHKVTRNVCRPFLLELVVLPLTAQLNEPPHCVVCWFPCRHLAPGRDVRLQAKKKQRRRQICCGSNDSAKAGSRPPRHA